MRGSRRAAVAAGVTAAAGVGLAIFEGMYPTAQLYGATAHRERAAGRRLALTFDDGPNPGWTPALLDLLALYDARATFFLIGKWAEREPALVRRTATAGHAIGNHTHSHPTMPAHLTETIRRELRRCRDAVEASGVRFSTIDGRALMRPPYGHRRPGTLRTLRAEGYVPVMWSITGFDWRARTTAQRITRRCLRARDGDIILLHDGSDEEPVADRSRTLASAEAILEYYSHRGYQFVTVPELVAAAH
ncbi:MAG: polysaccharide deacetylase family protein [Solirubrobacteraceae bacterium]